VPGEGRRLGVPGRPSHRHPAHPTVSLAGPTSLDPADANKTARRAFEEATEKHRDSHRRIRYVK